MDELSKLKITIEQQRDMLNFQAAQHNKVVKDLKEKMANLTLSKLSADVSVYKASNLYNDKVNETTALKAQFESLLKIPHVCGGYGCDHCETLIGITDQQNLHASMIKLAEKK